MEIPPEVAATMAKLQQQQREAEQIRHALDRLVVRGHSRGNEVTASIRGTGRVTEISIDPRALRQHDAHDVGLLVAEAVNNAQDRLARATEARLGPLIAAADHLAASM